MPARLRLWTDGAIIFKSAKDADRRHTCGSRCLNAEVGVRDQQSGRNAEALSGKKEGIGRRLEWSIPQRNDGLESIEQMDSGERTNDELRRPPILRRRDVALLGSMCSTTSGMAFNWGRRSSRASLRLPTCLTGIGAMHSFSVEMISSTACRPCVKDPLGGQFHSASAVFHAMCGADGVDDGAIAVEEIGFEAPAGWAISCGKDLLRLGLVVRACPLQAQGQEARGGHLVRGRLRSTGIDGLLWSERIRRGVSGFCGIAQPPSPGLSLIWSGVEAVEVVEEAMTEQFEISPSE